MPNITPLPNNYFLHNININSLRVKPLEQANHRLITFNLKDVKYESLYTDRKILHKAFPQYTCQELKCENTKFVSFMHNDRSYQDFFDSKSKDYNYLACPDEPRFIKFKRKLKTQTRPIIECYKCTNDFGTYMFIKLSNAKKHHDELHSNFCFECNFTDDKISPIFKEPEENNLQQSDISKKPLCKDHHDTFNAVNILYNISNNNN